MPNPTFILINSATVGSGGASSVSFTNIPPTFKDLVVKASVRSTRSGAAEDGMGVVINGNGATSWTLNSANGSSFLSGTSSSLGFGNAFTGRIPASTALANSFGNWELLIADYASANFKTYSLDAVTENNSSNAAFMSMQASYLNITSQVNSVVLSASNATLAQYSTFSLYGIRNY